MQQKAREQNLRVLFRNLFQEKFDFGKALACGSLDLGKGFTEVLHTLHAGCAGLVLVLQVPLLLSQHSCHKSVV